MFGSQVVTTPTTTMPWLNSGLDELIPAWVFAIKVRQNTKKVLKNTRKTFPWTEKYHTKPHSQSTYSSQMWG